MKRIVLAVALVFAVVTFTGCSGTPKVGRYNVVLSPADSIAESFVEVDLIGVNEPNLADYENYPIAKYWSPGNSMRASADKVTVRLSGGSTPPLSMNNGAWDRWIANGARYLVVIANLPGGASTGASDPRRKVIPLEKKKWKKLKDDTIRIEIRDGMIAVLTAPRP